MILFQKSETKTEPKEGACYKGNINNMPNECKNKSLNIFPNGRLQTSQAHSSSVYTASDCISLICRWILWICMMRWMPQHGMFKYMKRSS